MNQGSSTTWHQELHGDPMLVADDDDFSNLLNLDLEFSGFEEPQTAYDGFDNPMGDLGMDQLAMGSSLQDLPGHGLQTVTSLPQMQPHRFEGELSQTTPGATSTSSTTHVYQQRQGQRQHYQQRRRQPNPHRSYPESRIIGPPTPQSSEMRGAARLYRYLNEDGIPEVDMYQIHRDDSMEFTPLASPAVTPVDPNLRHSDSTLPAENFSPLTSPAIEAQIGQARRRTHREPSTSAAAPLSSPPEMPTHRPTTISASQSTTRRNARRSSVSARGPGRSLRQSPLSNAQGYCKQSSLPIPPPCPAELPEHGIVAPSSVTDSPQILHGPSVSSEGSGQSSVSPEPLSEALMPPPSLPRSVGRSPVLSGNTHRIASANEPATPANLMKIPNQEPLPQASVSAGGTAQRGGAGLAEEMMLPESAANHSRKASIIDATGLNDEEEAIHNSSAKTPKLSAKSTPRTSSIKTQAQSSTDGRHRRAESRSEQGSKFRAGGPPASQASPAIRPKISPRVKPMIPNSNPGTPSLSLETSALYLASKSNYQNILEGTHLPGIHYPDNLAENLSSKRTSHKLAEQGRRNRINVALKEMERLLPATSIIRSKKDGSGSGEGDPGDRLGGSSNSKASTVEMAIAYIKALEVELSDTKVKLEDQEKRLAETQDHVTSLCADDSPTSAEGDK